MSADAVDQKKRHILVASALAMGGVGSAFFAIPLIKSWEPSSKARAAGAPVDVDVSKLEPGMLLTVEWRGKPVWILRRTEKMLESLDEVTSQLRDPDSEELSQQPVYAKNLHRSLRPEYVVLVGICTHLGCVPLYRPEPASANLGPDWKGGFFCPCHGSLYDLAGRVYVGMPAPSNLVVPPHRFVTETRLLIGVDRENS